MTFSEFLNYYYWGILPAAILALTSFYLEIRQAHLNRINYAVELIEIIIFLIICALSYLGAIIMLGHILSKFNKTIILRIPPRKRRGL